MLTYRYNLRSKFPVFLRIVRPLPESFPMPLKFTLSFRFMEVGLPFRCRKQNYDDIFHGQAVRIQGVHACFEGNKLFLRRFVGGFGPLNLDDLHAAPRSESFCMRNTVQIRRAKNKHIKIQESEPFLGFPRN